MDGKLCDHYKELAQERHPYLDRGRNCSAITLPFILPPEGQSATAALPEKYTSAGARLVKNLGSKLLLSQLPPGAIQAFKIKVSTKALVEAGALTPPPELAKPLALSQQMAASKMESLGWRRPIFLSFLHLIVVGNVVEHIQPNGRIKLYRLDQFVVVRDLTGELLEVTTCEATKYRNLPAAQKNLLPGKKPDEVIHVYTRFEKVDDNSYSVRQDLDDVVLKAEEVLTGMMPVNALRWTEVPGEAYGRSHVEDNYDDLTALDMHCKHLLEAGAAASKHYVFVKPNAAGGNLRQRIEKARNGAIISANPDDVQGFSLDTRGAMETTQTQVERLIRELAESFLMTSALRRDAERVTAYELRLGAQELEAALGGVYSLLSEDMGWRIRKLIAQMKSRGEFPNIPGDSVEITVTTGLEALGNDTTINNAQTLLQIVGGAGALTQDAGMYVKFDEILTPVSAALGFSAAIRTDTEVRAIKQQELQAQTLAAMAQKAAAPMAAAAATSTS